jgi:hypothetical protein
MSAHAGFYKHSNGRVVQVHSVADAMYYQLRDRHLGRLVHLSVLAKRRARAAGSAAEGWGGGTVSEKSTAEVDRETVKAIQAELVEFRDIVGMEWPGHADKWLRLDDLIIALQNALERAS